MRGPPQSRGGGPPDNGTGFNRKRTFDEGFQSEQDREGQFQQNRTFKTPRRGRGGGGGMGDWSGRGPGPAPPTPTQVPGGAQFPPPGGVPGFPIMPPGFPPFDHNDPMATMMALQGMGFPPMPGMPPMPMPSTGGGGGAQGQAQAQLDQSGKAAQRCPFYETQGICYLGATCPYQHGPEGGAGPLKQDGMSARQLFLGWVIP